MRPICLTIQGLHSFREKQTIRFDELSGAGVFGIFGPTGSGKSTILDAITLALYGTVGRAKNGTQGILNHAEKSLEVSFQFQLGSGADLRMYRVDRRYDRNKDITVKNGYTRLVELDVSGEVLAVLSENNRDVTNMVEELLGLKEEDFSRAVVLPQGKFQEFLHLNGKERRVMLQRLFALEQYGTELTNRLNQRFNETEGQLKEVKARQDEMGDCSQEAVERAELLLQDARTQEKSAVAEFQATQRAFEGAKQIREWQQQLQGVLERIAAHETLSDEIEQLNKRIFLSERAEKVLPYVKRFEEAEQAERKRLEELEGLELAIGSLRSETEVLLQQWETAKQERAVKSPELIKRKTHLETARGWEEEVQKLLTRVNGLKEDVSRLQEQQAQNISLIGRLTKEQEEAQSEQERQKEILNQNQVAPEFRALVYEAGTKRDTLTAAQQTLQEAQKDYAQRATDLESIEAKLAREKEHLQELTEKAQDEVTRLNELSAAPPTTEETLAQQAVVLTELKGKLEQLLKLERVNSDDTAKAAKLDEELSSLKRELENTSNQLKEAREQQSILRTQYQEAVLHNKKALAIQLASDLCKGEACPVCGSHEHPNPAVMSSLTEGVAEETDSLQASLQNTETRVQELAEKEASLKATLNAKTEQLDDLHGTISGRARELQQMASELQEALSVESADATHLQSGLAQEQARVEELRALFSGWKEQVKSLEAAVKELREEMNQVASIVAVLEQSVKTGQAEKEKASLLLKRKEEQAAQAEQDLQKVLQALGVESVEQAAAELKEKDEQSKQAQDNLKALDEQLVVLSKQLAEATKQESDLRAQVAVATGDLRNAEEQFFRKQEELNKITGGTPVAELLVQTAAELRALEEREAAALKAHEERKARLQETEQQLAQAKALYEEAVKSLETANKELRIRMDEFHFVTADEVKDSVWLPEELSQAKNRVQEYQDTGKVLQTEKEKLQSHLQGKTLTEEEWQEMQSRLEEAEQNQQQATAMRGAAESEHQKLFEKHTRWKELDKQRQVLEKEAGYLAQLKQLLRGEKFVEFLAQEQLEYVAQQASDRLKRLTRNRYALEVTEDGFSMRDDANGGVKRPVTSLSGGETFLTSLALALSLSSQIQLRGKYPLEFFFLDEGFGTLDQELLDVVMSTLEQLQMENMTIGVISHVPELQQRLHRRLVVQPAEAVGRGTQVRIERN
ncbi:AAA family ATPase [Effusibacillus consociatus]|uniref:Nuclease SbcCD subunit C n=1 Tax=Effusibacillus consociatus TaxID=1117041 RepID=A0ABV9PZ80_9BACL